MKFQRNYQFQNLQNPILLKVKRKVSLEENLEAFSDGFGMKHMPYAAKQMADFMVKVGFIPEKPDMSKLFDSSFVKNIS